MARRRGRYRMTPRRRAALKKAQAASARKRRFAGVKNFAKTAGAIGGTVLAGALLYHAESYARDPGKLVRHTKAAHSFVRHGRGGDPNAPRPRPIRGPAPKYYGRPRVPLRRGVAGRRISSSQRSRLG